jgi:prepilin-type N-terminal cleavage/methylation domain-containing protein
VEEPVYKINSEQGFTLLELLSVAAIITTLSVALVFNFRPNRNDITSRNQSTSSIESDIRRTQTMVLSGARYNNEITCGYGLHYIDQQTYIIYAKLPPGGACSALGGYNYQAGDVVVETRKILSSNLEMRLAFEDIFFAPPDPKTYVNDSDDLSAAPSSFTIQGKGQTNCVNPTCSYVKVYTSGKVDIEL